MNNPSDYNIVLRTYTTTMFMDICHCKQHMFAELLQIYLISCVILHYKLATIMVSALILIVSEREISLSIIAEKTQQRKKNT